MVSMEDAKNYLRIDHNEDDNLIQNLIQTAQKLCMDIGRMDEKELEMNEETARQAMLYTIAYLYENRNTADYYKLSLMLRALLFAQREGTI
ncbi:MAG TPA: AraC family transcriptional regulator [Ruminococcus sp.]|nr:AraC family transcriptional regulator [Ruminococcus sp.]